MNTQDILDELRYEWRGHAVVDDAYEALDIRLNSERIADWWLAKFALQEQRYKEEMMEVLREIQWEIFDTKKSTKMRNWVLDIINKKLEIK